jgi:hypothetical protein
MIEGDFSTAFARVRELAEDFQAGEQQFLQNSYSEAQARKDFIDKFRIALGWDVNHEREKNPYRQEIKFESRVKTGERKSERTRKADYPFYAAPNFRDVKLREITLYQDRRAALDRQIDRLVYDLYDLAPEEIEIVEGKTGN